MRQEWKDQHRILHYSIVATYGEIKVQVQISQNDDKGTLSMHLKNYGYNTKANIPYHYTNWCDEMILGRCKVRICQVYVVLLSDGKSSSMNAFSYLYPQIRRLCYQTYVLFILVRSRSQKYKDLEKHEYSVNECGFCLFCYVPGAKVVNCMKHRLLKVLRHASK